MRQMREVGASERRATVFCFQHNRKVAVLTDAQIVTRVANEPYPSTSTAVCCPCPRCSREDHVVWHLDVRKLRTIKRQGGSGKAVDVRAVAPDWLLEEYGAVRS